MKTLGGRRRPPAQRNRIDDLYFTEKRSQFVP